MTDPKQDRVSHTYTPPILQLPEAPTHLKGPVKAWAERVELLTYSPDAPDRNPMFLEKRVYQGSSGRVYPLPFYDRIAIDPEVRSWDALHIENEFVRLMILPGIGGRIHVGYDKTTGYDFFYRQNVIKPALVGLAGPWVSGGVEFNWPQHHRPATYMPVETEIEVDEDGSATLWCSDHDPMLRMKGMHGVRLRPGSSAVELRVRLYNRTPMTQTFLWWTNIATRVHEQYQSFFPTDVQFVADHAKRAVTSFPLADRPYYGVDYPNRAKNGVPADEQPAHFRPDGSYAANDLRWYSNIPVPTSYMILGTEEDFLGGYDHREEVGFVHVANHRIAPGKKQWTWGNQEFGYAWDRSLTDHDGPYIELMAGVYTDNQPDFSFLTPWETRTFTQTWYPIERIGVPQMANKRAALNLVTSDHEACLSICVTEAMPGATIALHAGERTLVSWVADLSPGKPVTHTYALQSQDHTHTLRATVTHHGATVISYDPSRITRGKQPSIGQEPATPDEIATVEELYLTGLHLEQYRHATRLPESYWQEGLRRDPHESRLNNALGLWHLRRGNFELAHKHFDTAITRLTRLNPNPRDGEAFYNLGITLRYRGDVSAAYDAFYKATWNSAWSSSSYFALAEIDAMKHEWVSCREHLEQSLRGNVDHLHARNLLATVLRTTGQTEDARILIAEILELDPLDLWARWLDGESPKEGQACLDLAYDLLRSGFREEAATVLKGADLSRRDGAAPMVLLTLNEIAASDGASPQPHSLGLTERDLDYCFPSRLEELQVLERACHCNPDDWASHYLLGNLLYDRRRHEEAIDAWENAARCNPDYSVLLRNLGIGAFNVRRDMQAALAWFDRAHTADANDARVFYERDQLWKRVGVDPVRRKDTLEGRIDLVARRDDLVVELAGLRNQTGDPHGALDLLLGRKFQPWEGGEGSVLGEYLRACMQIGSALLDAGEAKAAFDAFARATTVPESLGEAKHLLANQSDLFYWLGEAAARLDRNEEAEVWWRRAAEQKGDFQEMSVRSISDKSFWSALAHRRLGALEQAESLLREIEVYGRQLGETEARIDYFATSLPTMLIFEDDLQQRRKVESFFLQAQAAFGLGSYDEAQRLLREVLTFDKNHAAAADLLRLLQHQVLPKVRA